MILQVLLDFDDQFRERGLSEPVVSLCYLHNGETHDKDWGIRLPIDNGIVLKALYDMRMHVEKAAEAGHWRP